MLNRTTWVQSVFLSLSILITTVVQPAGWNLETLDTIIGEHPILVTDSHGLPHVFYLGTSGFTHIWKSGNNWWTDLIPYGTDTFSATLDSSDHPCFAFVHYGDFMEMFVSYVFWDGSAWQREQIIRTTTNFTGDISLILDSHQQPHITVNLIHDYGPAHSSTLWYFHRGVSGEWNLESLDGLNSNARLALDENDSPVIIYRHRSSIFADYEWRFCCKSDDQWIVEPLMFDGDFVNIGTLFFCNDNSLQFIYTEQFRMTDTGRLMRAIRSGTGWTRECLAETYYLIFLPDSVPDIEDAPHTVFFLRELDPVDTSYIKHTFFAGSFWMTETVDTDPEFIRFPRIASTSCNDLHVVYVYDDGDYRELRYGYRPPAPLYHLFLMDDLLTYGGWFFLSRTCQYPGRESVTLDEYIIFDVHGEFWFWPLWTREAGSVSLLLTPGDQKTDVILDFPWPSDAGSGSGLAFWGGLLDPESQLLLALDRVMFSYE